jgi:hypothetical protein
VISELVSVFGVAPSVGPLPASSVDTAPFVEPLPASAFGCANAGAERPTAITERSKLPRNKGHEQRSFGYDCQSTRFDHGKFRFLRDRSGIFDAVPKLSP